MKKKFFDISFDPKMQPGSESRRKSLDSLLGVRINQELGTVDRVTGQNMSYDGFVSGTAWQTLPSRQYRKYGLV